MDNNLITAVTDKTLLFPVALASTTLKLKDFTLFKTKTNKKQRTVKAPFISGEFNNLVFLFIWLASKKIKFSTILKKKFKYLLNHLNFTYGIHELN